MEYSSFYTLDVRVKDVRLQRASPHIPYLFVVFPDLSSPEPKLPVQRAPPAEHSEYAACCAEYSQTAAEALPCNTPGALSLAQPPASPSRGRWLSEVAPAREKPCAPRLHPAKRADRTKGGQERIQNAKCSRREKNAVSRYTNTTQTRQCPRILIPPPSSYSTHTCIIKPSSWT